MTSVFYAAPAGAAEPYLLGTQLEEKEDKVRVQPASGGAASWMPKKSVFLKSPAPTNGESPSTATRARAAFAFEWRHSPHE